MCSGLGVRISAGVQVNEVLGGRILRQVLDGSEEAEDVVWGVGNPQRPLGDLLFGGRRLVL